MTFRALIVLSLFTGCTVGTDPDPDSKAGAGGVALVEDPGADTTVIEARVCAQGTTTMGVDVSYYQGTVDWAKAKAAGVKFAFLRVSDGTTFRDPKFVQNWANTKTAGVIRGAYQFFRPSQNVNAQADLMIAALGTYQPGDLPPVIDVEAWRKTTGESFLVCSKKKSPSPKGTGRERSGVLQTPMVPKLENVPKQGIGSVLREASSVTKNCWSCFCRKRAQSLARSWKLGSGP